MANLPGEAEETDARLARLVALGGPKGLPKHSNAAIVCMEAQPVLLTMLRNVKEMNKLANSYLTTYFRQDFAGSILKTLLTLAFSVTRSCIM